MSNWFGELLEQEMTSRGFKRIAVGPGPLKTAAREKGRSKSRRGNPADAGSGAEEEENASVSVADMLVKALEKQGLRRVPVGAEVLIRAARKKARSGANRKTARGHSPGARKR